MRVFSRSAVAVVLMLGVGASAQQPGRGGAGAGPTTPRASGAPRAAVPPHDAPVPFQVGEALTYDVAWSGYLVAGSAVSRVIDKRPSSNSTAYYIVAEGRPLPIIARIYALYYKMDSLLDAVTSLSQRSSLYTEEGTRKRTTITTFNRQSKRALFEVQTDTDVKNEFAVPQNVQDGLATLYTLRAHTFAVGDHMSIPVADNGMLYTATFDVTGPTPVKVPLGQMDAWQLGVTILDSASQQVGSNIAAWISTDARRLPLKLQADLPVGSFTLVLRSAQ